MTIGVVGRKTGMTRVFTEEGVSVPVTVVQVEPNRVSQVKTVETDGYASVQLAYDEKKDKNTSKPMKGHFAKANTTAKKKLVEFKKFNDAKTIGEVITAELFVEGDLIDVVGTSKGKGFQGVVKRHGFAGVGGQTHGQHNRLRAPGSLGASSWPSRVFKGMRMAGRMGGDRVKVQNLQILKVYPEQNLLVVSGSIPGAKGSYVILEK